MEILQILDTIVRQQSIISLLEQLIVRVEKKLSSDRGALLSWETVPLEVFSKTLPNTIKSSWVFVLRANSCTGAERHPNSHQRMISFHGSGDLQVWDGEKWCSNLLVSDTSAQIEKRCLSIPPTTWHQAVVPENNWVVVSFHTVLANELIEERPDPNDPQLTYKRKYIEKQTL
ncbi:MAG: hypothetical protein ABR954_00315 [Dehalococcoidales bacterium]